ncbi:MAG: hypothetical protein J6J11_03100 [Treponema sp.]|nr:hypothetical protein [Clostridia bacterium]MBP3607288.1 hypothetical protein [Treponema sp.]
MITSKFLTLYKLVMEHLDYSTPPGIVSNSKFPSTNALNIPFTFEFGSHSMSMKKGHGLKNISYSNAKIYQKYDERND